MAHPFRLYNTLNREVEDFVPATPGEVSLYVCGNTVYSDAHIGHGRAMIVFDMVVRHLRTRGWQVRFVRNFTDVDDKIIAAAATSGEEPLALSARFIERYREDAAALGLVEPDVGAAVPRARRHAVPVAIRFPRGRHVQLGCPRNHLRFFSD